MILKILIEIILVVALIIGYINEDKIANWEREVFFPYIRERIKGDVKNDKN